ELGTAEGIARELADVGTSYGFAAQVGLLNDYIGKLPRNGAVLIVTSSYNGKPPVRAKKFVDWLSGLGAGELNGINYAVFGCGDKNWQSTYQAIPRWVDEHMHQLGAHRCVTRGEGDASLDFEAQLIDWQQHFWPTLSNAMGIAFSNVRNVAPKKTLKLEFVSEEASPLVGYYKAGRAKVVKTRELQASSSPRRTTHLELALPKEMTYQVGDHLGVIPQNSSELVDRVLRRFAFTRETKVVLQASSSRLQHLPLDRPVLVSDLLKKTVELQEPATRSMLRELVATTHCPPHKKELEALLNEERYKEAILLKRVSMLDLLEAYPSCEMTFEQFLELLPALKPRYYSISSAPEVEGGTNLVTVTVAVVHEPAWIGNGTYLGVASNYLARKVPGEEVDVFVKHPENGFTVPENPKTPIIMVGAGTGLAPFRGFLQARRQLAEQGVVLGDAHLFFGCRNHQDYLYQEELEAYQEQGLVTLHTAFSRLAGAPKTYVQHLLKKKGRDMMALLEKGGILYLCGDGKHMAPDVEATLHEIYREAYSVSEEEAMAWLTQLQNEGRYLKDVWAGN
ncbi:MAG TPA: flavodoxin domain-containing protein, partial [Sporolactobacillaceae bacterium]|nr:flavodoxin domain-containing protein [Sporolactobacillaceae bacterium]